MIFKLILPDDELLTPEQLAERLSVPVAWVHEQTRTRARRRNGDVLPHTHMGHYLRFSWREVCDWLSRHEVNGRKKGKEVIQ